MGTYIPMAWVSWKASDVASPFNDGCAGNYCFLVPMMLISIPHVDVNSYNMWVNYLAMGRLGL
jgi:hypothetical protein